MNAGASDARALYSRGVDGYARGRAAGALRLFRRAVGLLEDEPPSGPVQSLRGRIWLSIAVCEAELRGPASSAGALDRARAAATLADDRALAVLVHAQTGSMALRAGRLTEAAAHLDLALADLRLLDDRDRAVLLLNRGTVALYLGDLRRARTMLRRAVAAAPGDALAVQRLQATHNLAYVEFLLGDLPAALRGMAEAARIIPDFGGGIALLDRARVLAEAGLVREADETLAAAAAIFARDRLGQDLGETELERARCALLAGDAEGARRLAMRARDRFRRRGNDRWRCGAELVLLQADLAAGRPGGVLAPPALRLREELRRDGAHLDARTAGLIAAEAYLSAGRPSEARAVLGTVGRGTTGDPITVRLHGQFVRARLDAETGHRAAAVRRARAGLDQLARYQSSFGSIELATAAAVHGRRLAALDLSVALAAGRAELVLAAAERGRAVSNRLRAVRPPHDPVVAELLTELRQTVEALRAVEREPGAAEPLRSRRRELESQIAARGWSTAGAGVVQRVVSPEQLRAAVGDAALVSYSRSDGELHAVVVEARRLRLLHLGPAGQVDELVRRARADLDVLARPGLLGPLRASVSASLMTSLAGLDAVLLRPLGLGSRLLIAPTGVLGQLPWGLLPSARGVPVVVAPSATAWHAAHTRRPGRRRGVVAVAGPGLARGADEAAEVGRIWGARLLTGEQATGSAVAGAIAGAHIAHLAAHGVHQTENPLFSELRLADGPLFAHDFDRRARAPDHVVLSACELGLATIRPGDEALGLTSVLLHLGSRCVVAGVARVGDDAAAAAMADYHGRLAGGEDTAAALAGALVATPVPFVCFGAAYRAVPRM